jgi:hypothetical protein
MIVKSNDVEELVVKNGGNGGNGDVLPKVETSKVERVAFAKGMKRLPVELVERYETILDAYAAKLKDRIDLNIKKATQMAEQGTGIEIAEPFSGVFYKWWDLFLVGPFQIITAPPFLPHKVIAAGEPAFFLAFVVKNPLPTPGPGPSALTILNGRPFNLNAEMVNLTTVTDGPDIPIANAFNGAVVQPFLLVFIAPVPAQGKPDLYEINVTLDVNDPFLQPIAGFATTIVDVDTDPGFPTFPASGPHLHVEQPMRFLVYNP